MMSIDRAQQFAAEDERFFSRLYQAKSQDTLGFRTDGALEPFQGLDAQPTSQDVITAQQRLNVWGTPPFRGESEHIAARRDFDKIIGAYVAHKDKLPHELQLVIHETLGADGHSPRSDFYDYAIANRPDLEGTYTGDPREIRLIEIFGASITAAHHALRAVVIARALLRQRHGVKAGEKINDAIDYLGEMHAPMIQAYRDVGPEFVAKGVTRFIGPIEVMDAVYEGPNPSHSGFVALDRFVLGSFDRVLHNDEGLQKQHAYRVSDLPPHLKELIDDAEDKEDDQSLLRLTEEYAPALSVAALEAITRIRKFKVIHKSYADKGLIAKKKALTPDEPDVLSQGVMLARIREETEYER